MFYTTTTLYNYIVSSFYKKKKKHLFSVLHIRKTATNLFVTFSVNHKVLYSSSAGSSGVRSKARRKNNVLDSLIISFKKFVRYYVRTHDDFYVFRDIIVRFNAPIKLVKSFVRQVRKYIRKHLIRHNEKRMLRSLSLCKQYQSDINLCKYSLSLLKLRKILRKIYLKTDFYLLSHMIRLICNRHYITKKHLKKMFSIYNIIRDYNSYILNYLYSDKDTVLSTMFDSACENVVIVTNRMYGSRIFFHFMGSHLYCSSLHMSLLQRVCLFKQQSYSVRTNYSVIGNKYNYHVFNSFFFYGARYTNEWHSLRPHNYNYLQSIRVLQNMPHFRGQVLSKKKFRRYIKVLAIRRFKIKKRTRKLARRTSSLALSMFRVIMFVNKSTVPFNGCRSSTKFS